MVHSNKVHSNKMNIHHARKKLSAHSIKSTRQWYKKNRRWNTILLIAIYCLIGYYGIKTLYRMGDPDHQNATIPPIEIMLNDKAASSGGVLDKDDLKQYLHEDHNLSAEDILNDVILNDNILNDNILNDDILNDDILNDDILNDNPARKWLEDFSPQDLQPLDLQPLNADASVQNTTSSPANRL